MILDIGLSRCAALLFLFPDVFWMVRIPLDFWYYYGIYIDACVLVPLATVSCSIQMNLVVFVHTAYGVEHIGPPEPSQAIGVFDLPRLQLTKQVNFLTWAAGKSNKEN